MSVNRELILGMLRDNNKRMYLGVSIHQFGPTLLHAVADYPEVLAQNLESLADKGLISVKTKDQSGNSVLHKAAENPQSLKMILELYPKDELLAALRETNHQGETVLHLAARNEHSLQLLSSYFSANELITTAREKDKSGNTALHRATANAPALSQLLSFYPNVEQQRKALQEKNHAGDTVFHKAVPYADSLVILLTLIHENEQRAVLNIKNNSGTTILLLALNYSAALNAIFKWLLPENQTYAVTEGGKYRYDLLHWATSPQAIQAILSFFTEEQCLNFITKTDVQGETLLGKTMQNTPRLLAILQRFPETINWQLCTHQNHLVPYLNNAQTLQQLLTLHVRIKQLKDFGMQVAGSTALEHNTVDLVNSLSDLVEKFVAAKINSKPEEIGLIQAQFKEKIEKVYKELQSHNEFLIAIFANLAIAATGIGILVIAAKLVLTGSTFFMETKRQQQAGLINASFQELTTMPPFQA
ncbi:MAG: hypothetical protein P4L79_03145 [Legionella sp.]|uniref:hypothetical protein n=1 Tax=Legionella sp. TaxID=459 RepID=UPI002851EBD9|nr:hypothetical protein [Legionella sp.]